MLIGVYGLLLEGYNPGAVLPGVVGAICLLLALYAFQVLSVNYAGLGLILLGTRTDRRRGFRTQLRRAGAWRRRRVRHRIDHSHGSRRARLRDCAQR